MFAYARSNPRPSGIQRVAFELCRALHERCGASGPVHFVRHDPSALGFLSVSWDEVAALFTRLADGKLASSINPGPARRSALSRGLADGIVAHLPLSVQMSAETALRAQSAAFRAWGSLGSVVARGGLRRLGPLLERLRSARRDDIFAREVSKRRRGYGGWLTMGADGLRRIDFRAAGTGIALRGTVLRSDSSASSGVVRSGDRALVPGVGGFLAPALRLHVRDLPRDRG